MRAISELELCNLGMIRPGAREISPELWQRALTIIIDGLVTNAKPHTAARQAA
jgi:hypothetical protein